ncbi:hypothetical protein C8J57DRAFT_1129696 [Mycena rebaudengoi]|nr:hypothetical protein C8J57DRAFT_1129696 [Mycena rebaudengoi]
MGNIYVFKKTDTRIECFVSKYTSSKGDDGWFVLTEGTSDQWERGDGWEFVTFRTPNSVVDPKRGGIYVPTGHAVTFSSFDNIVHAPV